MSVPVLSDGVVTLRAHTPADVDAMLAMCRDPEALRRTRSRGQHPRAVENYAFTVVAHGWDEGTHRGWAIEAEGAVRRQHRRARPRSPTSGSSCTRGRGAAA